MKIPYEIPYENFLDEDSLSRKKQISADRENIKILEKKIKSHIRDCHHKVDPNYKHYVKCAICDEFLSHWHCDKSPDGCCHYYSDDGEVALVDGTKHQLPEDHDIKFESDEFCIFCGEPEERK